MEFSKNVREALADIACQFTDGGLGALGLDGADNPYLAYRARSYGRGEDPLVYLTLFDLWRAQALSRFLCRYNEYALCAIENRVNYVCGDSGYSVEVTAVNPHDPEALAAVKHTTEFLRMFEEANGIADMQSESVNRADEDGEYFVRLFYRRNGLTDLRFIEPEHVQSSLGDTNDLRYSFGIETDGRDVVTPLKYWVMPEPWRSAISEPIDADEVVHFKHNCKQNQKRGVPTFLSVGANLRRCEDILGSMAQLARTRAKIALIRKLTGVAQDQAETLLAKLTKKTRTDADGDTDSVEKLKGGTILTAGANMAYEFPDYRFGAMDFVEVLQAELRAVASRFCMPEWMFSAVADAKYSNAFVVEAPANKMFTRVQKRQHRTWVTGRVGFRRSIYWRAILWAAQCRLLPANVATLVQLKASGPSIESRDKKAEADTNAVYMDRGLKDGSDVQREQGIDPDQTAQARIASFREGRLAIPVAGITSIIGLLGQMKAGSLAVETGYMLIGNILTLPKEVVKQAYPLSSPGDPKPAPALETSSSVRPPAKALASLPDDKPNNSRQGNPAP